MTLRAEPPSAASAPTPAPVDAGLSAPLPPTAGPPPAPTQPATPSPTPQTLRVGVIAPAADALETAPIALAGVPAAAAQFGWEYRLETADTEPEAYDAVQALVESGADIIVTLGARLANPTHAGASYFPEILFVGVEQPELPPLPNLLLIGGEASREDQGGFLAGALAGLVSEARAIGILVDTDTLAGRKWAGGADHGVRYTCPLCQRLTVELSDPNAAAEGAAAARDLLAQHADVLISPVSPAGREAARAAAEAGAWVIGAQGDISQTPGLPPERVLASARTKPEIALFDLFADVAAQRVPTAPMLYSLAQGTIGLDLLAGQNLPSIITQALDEITARLIAGSLETGIDPRTGLAR